MPKLTWESESQTVNSALPTASRHFSLTSLSLTNGISGPIRMFCVHITHARPLVCRSLQNSLLSIRAKQCLWRASFNKTNTRLVGNNASLWGETYA